MESSTDRLWATKYLVDPLTAPEPSQETGPGSHFYTVSPVSSSPSPSHKRHASTGRSSALPTPPNSASPSRSSFHPSNPFASVPASPDPRYSSARRSQHDSRDMGAASQRRDRRHSSSSLSPRFSNNASMRPLDQIRKETKDANRAPHLRRGHIPRADCIDILDQSAFGVAYHHGGPYDATLLVRNTDVKSSPVAATQSTNEEAIRATPREHIIDSLTKHVPLQGTAIVPPGEQTMSGVTMNYQEGADLQREPDAPGGAYKRWEHLTYHPEDYKGKSEPSFMIEKNLKERSQINSHRRIMSDGNAAYEMQTPRSRHLTTRQRSASGNNVDLSTSTGSFYNHRESNSKAAQTSTSQRSLGRHNSTGHRVAEGIKRKLGSFRKKHITTA